jgi:hypothetical protein
LRNLPQNAREQVLPSLFQQASGHHGIDIHQLDGARSGGYFVAARARRRQLMAAGGQAGYEAKEEQESEVHA